MLAVGYCRHSWCAKIWQLNWLSGIVSEGVRKEA